MYFLKQWIPLQNVWMSTVESMHEHVVAALTAVSDRLETEEITILGFKISVAEPRIPEMEIDVEDQSSDSDSDLDDDPRFHWGRESSPESSLRYGDSDSVDSSYFSS